MKSIARLKHLRLFLHGGLVHSYNLHIVFNHLIHSTRIILEIEDSCDYASL